MIGRKLAAVTALAAATLTAGDAQALETVRFGASWLPEVEHGGDDKAWLDVTIVPGGPQVNNRALATTT